MEYGYARASTNSDKQDIGRQKRALMAIGVKEYNIIMWLQLVQVVRKIILVLHGVIMKKFIILYEEDKMVKAQRESKSFRGRKIKWIIKIKV